MESTQWIGNYNLYSMILNNDYKNLPDLLIYFVHPSPFCFKLKLPLTNIYLSVILNIILIQLLRYIRIVQSCRSWGTVYWRPVISKQWKESIELKYNPYRGLLNVDNKTHLPARMTTQGYRKMEWINRKIFVLDIRVYT